jgi:hypothetical protein
LFAPRKNSLVIYNMMFPRWSEDQRAGAPGGKTAELPLVEQPCPSCTSVVDGLEGAAPTHKNAAGATCACCPRGTTPSTALTRRGGIHHHRASEMTFKHSETSCLDPVWAIYGVLDLTREGSGDSAAYPDLQY